MIKSIASSSSGNCHVVDNEILLDCGVKLDTLREHLGNLTKLSGCLCSHSHQDHCSAVEDLLDASVEVYMDEATKDEMELDHYRLHTIEPINETYQIGNFKIKGFPLVHDSEGGTGFLLKGNGKKIAYITDTEVVEHSFRGLTHLMIESNYSWQIINRQVQEGEVARVRKNRTIANHLSLEDVISFLSNIDKSKLREIRLLHLSKKNSNRKQFKREIQEATGIPVKVAPRLRS